MQKANGMSDTASAIGISMIPANCGSLLIERHRRYRKEIINFPTTFKGFCG